MNISLKDSRTKAPGRRGLAGRFAGRYLPTMLIAAIGSISVAWGGGIDSVLVHRVRPHFEWGEYDTVLRYLETTLDTISSDVDSTNLAHLHAWLGVAFFAKGRPAEAREQFRTSYRCDTAFTLPADFVGRPAQDLFLSTREEQRRLAERERELVRKDSLLAGSRKEARDVEAVVTSIKQERVVRIRRRKLILGFGTWALAAVPAGFSVYQFGQGEEFYEKFLEARRKGDLTRYRKYRTRTDRADFLTLFSAGGSMLLGATGMYFLLTRGSERLETAVIRPDLVVTRERWFAFVLRINIDLPG